jgi:hypothetical protein
MKHVILAVPVTIVALMLAALGAVTGVTPETPSVEHALAATPQALVACFLPEVLNAAAVDIPMTSVPSPHGCAELPLRRVGPGSPWLAEC